MQMTSCFYSVHKYIFHHILCDIFKIILENIKNMLLVFEGFLYKNIEGLYKLLILWQRLTVVVIFVMVDY